MARPTGELDEERRSYSAVFVFAVGLLLAGAVWSIWDDNISRRPWKKYQTEYFELEAQHIRKAAHDEQEKLDKNPDYKRVVAQIKEAKERLKSGDTAKRLAELREKERRAGITVSERDADLRIVKSKIEEAWYEYDHAMLTGEDTVAPKARLTALEQERDEKNKALDDSQARKDQVTKEIDEIDGEVSKLEAQRTDMERDLSAIQQKLDGVTIHVGPFEFPKIPHIEQVVVNDFDRSSFDTPLNRVDRCQSCHIAINKPGFENEPNPLKTHPHRELLAKHPIEKFGCTPCHEGQGPAVNSAAEAHGEVEFWERPLLRGDKVQANCIKCHLNTRNLPLATTIGRGQTLFEELGCHGCHLTDGYESMQKVGPSLRRIAAKADPTWLVHWVENPHVYRPKTRMPNFMFKEDQAVKIASYLLDSTRADSQAWLDAHPAPEGINPQDAALVARGEELVNNIGCRGCHSFVAGQSPALLGENKDIAPNLSNVAMKTDPRWMYHWIKNPRGYSPVARMPNLRLSDDEARAIVSYLSTLGEKKSDPALVAQLSDPKNVEAGKSLVRKYGCFGCHDVTGMENESRIGVELSAFGSKPLEELFFGDHTDIPHTWDDWTYHKLENPRTYQTERIEQLMPNFELANADIKALRVFLASRTDNKMPPAFMIGNNPRLQKIAAGQRLVARYNCVGCHIIDGQGGAIRALYTEKPTLAPPILNGEGSKVQSDWLFGFVKEPISLRPWLKLRMPTFGLSDEEATTLVDYLDALDNIETPYVHIVDAAIPEGNLEAGQKLMSKDYFDCFSCHQQGDKKPEGPPDGWAPDLAMARRRLNPDWIIRWLHNPQALQPGAKMPSFYPGGPDDILGGDEDKQIEALRDYIMTLGAPKKAVVARTDVPKTEQVN